MCEAAQPGRWNDGEVFIDPWLHLVVPSTAKVGNAGVQSGPCHAPDYYAQPSARSQVTHEW